MIADPMPVVTWVARRAGALIDLRELADRVVIGEVRHSSLYALYKPIILYQLSRVPVPPSYISSVAL